MEHNLLHFKDLSSFRIISVYTITKHFPIFIQMYFFFVFFSYKISVYMGNERCNLLLALKFYQSF